MTEQSELIMRVRRVLPRWPITELDPIERSEFAAAVARAETFADLDPHWQQLIAAAERGPVEAGPEFHLKLRHPAR
jgi:hypothetical protein